MTNPVPDDAEHPLHRDRARLERILNNVYAEIQKTLFRTSSPRPTTVDAEGDERVLAGGASADDVLQDVLIALLLYPEPGSVESWEALATRIAQNKAKDAIRHALKGRRLPGSNDTDGPNEIALVSLDADDDEIGASIADTLAAHDDPETTYIENAQQLFLVRYARQLLTERERLIYFEVHHLATPKATLGKRLGITGARVGQIYLEVLIKLDDASQRDPQYLRISDPDERRNR